MKTTISLLLLIFFYCSLYAQSTYLIASDLRDSVIQPSFYYKNVRVNFKNSSTMSLPSTENQLYVTSLGLRGWLDDTGGSAHELVFTNNNGLYYRAGTNKGGWKNWQKILSENVNGNVGIGIVNPTERLSVNGNIRAKEIKVEASNWPDYVFKDEYELSSLENIHSFIKKNGHLPGVPRASEVEQNGISLGEMNKILLQKIEELTLYLIEKDKQLEIQNKIILKIQLDIKNIKSNSLVIN